MRYYHERKYIFTECTCHSCQILKEPEFSQQIYEKYPNTEFQENLPSGSTVVP